MTDATMPPLADTPVEPAAYELNVPLQETGGRYLFDPATGKSKLLPDDEDEAGKAIARAERAAAKADDPKPAKPADTTKGAE